MYQKRVTQKGVKVIQLNGAVEHIAGGQSWFVDHAGKSPVLNVYASNFTSSMSTGNMPMTQPIATFNAWDGVKLNDISSLSHSGEAEDVSSTTT